MFKCFLFYFYFRRTFLFSLVAICAACFVCYLLAKLNIYLFGSAKIQLPLILGFVWLFLEVCVIFTCGMFIYVCGSCITNDITVMRESNWRSCFTGHLAKTIYITLSVAAIVGIVVLIVMLNIFLITKGILPPFTGKKDDGMLYFLIQLVAIGSVICIAICIREDVSQIKKTNDTFDIYDLDAQNKDT